MEYPLSPSTWDLPHRLGARFRPNGTPIPPSPEYPPPQPYQTHDPPRISKTGRPIHYNRFLTPRANLNPHPTTLAETCIFWYERLHNLFYDASLTGDSEWRALYAHTNQALQVITSAISKYTYEELAISYNGGKDCLVLLILYLAALGARLIILADPETAYRETSCPFPIRTPYRCHPNTTTTTTGPPPAEPPLPERLNAVYVSAPSAFPELTAFVQHTSEKYSLNLSTYAMNPPTTNFRQAFMQYLTAHPGTKAVLVGTRRSDPDGCRLSFTDRTDGVWREAGVDFVRVHPVIEWQYGWIWRFLRAVKYGDLAEVEGHRASLACISVPDDGAVLEEDLDRVEGFEWCELYGRGFTSLGGQGDTEENPDLAVRGEDGRITGHRPAWELKKGHRERAGRKWNPVPKRVNLLGEEGAGEEEMSDR